MQIRLTKIFHFHAAHALAGYDGKCSNIHGHTYTLEVTVAGLPVANDASPKNGMVFDFGDLRDVVQREVIDKFDHALILPANSPYTVTGPTKLVVVPFQPTVENLLLHFGSLIKPVLPLSLHLFSLRLHETDTSFGELFFD